MAFALMVGMAAALAGCRDAPAPIDGPADSEPGTAPGAERFQHLKGRWVRPDGGYLLEVTEVSADGRVTAGYYNPSPINVANARAVYETGQLKLFVELRDINYPGSTYTLRYDRDKNQLEGAYFQAAMNQTYDVVFVRAEE
jgi:hypothetical protein